jgi:MFS family permease
MTPIGKILMADAYDPYAALRLPDYRRLLLGNMLASIATQTQAVAVGWELYQGTDSPAALGFVGLVQFLPVLLLTLPAGHAADRYSRKGIVIAAQVLVALACLGLAVRSQLDGPIRLIYLGVLLVGVGQAFNSPARWSLIPLVVPDELLTAAVTWNSSGWQVASVVGPALGGLVVGELGLPAAYVVAGLCALGAATLLVPLRPRPAVRHTGGVTLDSVLAGLRFVRRNELMLAAITLDLFAVLLGGATALLPIFARDILHVGPVGFGWLRAAPSLGALLMAIVMAHRPPLRRAGPTLLAAVAGFGVATIVFGLSESAALSFIMLAITGALDNISVVVRGTLVQVLTPDTMRGRVSAVNALFIGSSNELGAFESGITAQWFGPVLSVVGGGVGTLLVVLIVAIQWPVVLRLDSLAAAAELPPQEPDGIAAAEPPAQ